MQHIGKALAGALGTRKIHPVNIVGECDACKEPIKEQLQEYPKWSERAGQEYIFRQCGCETAQISKNISDYVQFAQQQKHLHIFEKFSLMPESLKGLTFESFDPNNIYPSQEKALKLAARTAKEAITNDPDKKNLLLSGTYGIGKSHLAAAAVHEVLAAGKYAIFITLPKLFALFKDSYKRDSALSENDYLEWIAKADLFVLDDLGTVKDTEWTDEKLFMILEARTGKSTFYTTNLSAPDLAKNVGARNWDRIKNNTRAMKLEGESHRKFSPIKDDEFEDF